MYIKMEEADAHSSQFSLYFSNDDGTDKPSLKLSSKCVKPIILDWQWQHLELQLLGECSAPKLNIIDKNNSKDIVAYYREVLECWHRKVEKTLDELIDAVKLKTLELHTLAANIQLYILQDHEDFKHYEERFREDDVENAFIYLLEKLEALWSEVDIHKLRKVCTRDPRLSNELKSSLRDAPDLDIMFDLLSSSPFCTWLEITILKRMAKAAEIPEATRLIEAFEKCVHSRKCSEVELYFKKQYINPDHLTLVSAKLNENAEHLIVADLIKYCHKLKTILKLPATSNVLIKYSKGCLEISFVIPTCCFEIARNIRFQSIYIRYLQARTFSKVYTLNIENENTKQLLEQGSSSLNYSAKVIACYYTYLLNVMDADSVSHMMYCNYLITDNDYEAITAAPNDSKLNGIILEYARAMDLFTFLKSTDLLINIQCISEALEKETQEVCQRQESVSNFNVSQFETMRAVFHHMILDITKLLSISNICTIRSHVEQMCTPCSVHLSSAVVKKIKLASNPLDVLVNLPCWNWTDMRLLEVMAVACGLITAKKLLTEYSNGILKLEVLNMAVIDAPKCCQDLDRIEYDIPEMKIITNGSSSLACSKKGWTIIQTPACCITYECAYCEDHELYTLALMYQQFGICRKIPNTSTLYPFFTTVEWKMLPKEHPTMKQLVEVIRIKDIDITTRWYNLGVELVDSYKVLKVIEANHASDVDSCCCLMFEKWLEKTPDASWSQLVTALNSIEMNTAVDAVSKLFDYSGDVVKSAFLIMEKFPLLPSLLEGNSSSISASPVEFTDCENISTAFLLLTTEISNLLKGADFAGLRRALMQQRNTPGDVQFPDDLHQSIKAAKELDTLLDVLADSNYWNWIDLQLLDALIVSSGIQEAKYLIQKYKHTIFPKKLSEILDRLLSPQQKEHKEAYTTKVGTKIQKEPGDVIVGDLSYYCNILEAVIMDINNGSCVLEHLDQGCLVIHWLIPTHCRFHAYKSALNNRHKFCDIHLQYLHIEPYSLIYVPFTIQPTMLSTLLGLSKPIVCSIKLALEILSRYMKPLISTQWKILLEEKNVPKLNVIDKNNSKNMEAYCREIFQYWLRVNERSCWNELINALKGSRQNDALSTNFKQKEAQEVRPWVQKNESVVSQFETVSAEFVHLLSHINKNMDFYNVEQICTPHSMRLSPAVVKKIKLASNPLDVLANLPYQSWTDMRLLEVMAVACGLSVTKNLFTNGNIVATNAGFSITRCLILQYDVPKVACSKEGYTVIHCLAPGPCINIAYEPAYKHHAVLHLKYQQFSKIFWDLPTLTSFFVTTEWKILTTAASNSVVKNVSSTTTDSVCHHHDGTYCPECKKTVCMCTVKDHFLGEAEGDSAYKSKANISVKVADVLASFVIFNVVLLQLLLSYNHLTPLAYVSALRSTDFLCMDFIRSGYDIGIKNTTIMEEDSSVMAKIWMTLIIIDQKVINRCQKNYTSNTKEPHMATSFLFSDNEIQRDDQPSKNTNLAIFVTLIFFFILLLLSVFYNDFGSVGLQQTDNPKYKHLICKQTKQYLSECLVNSNSLSEGMLFVTNTEIQGYVDIQAIDMLENCSSCRNNIFEEIAHQLVEFTGCINLLCNKFGHKNLVPTLFLQVASDAWKKIKLERHAKRYLCKQECRADDFSILTSILSNLQLFVNKTLLSSQIAYNWGASSQKLLNIKESDIIFTKEWKDLSSIKQLLPGSNVIIQSDSQHKSCCLGEDIMWLFPEATSDDKSFVTKYPFATLQLLAELTFNNKDVNTGVMHAKNLCVKSYRCFVEKDEAFSGLSCQQSKLCNTALYSNYGALQVMGLCTRPSKLNLNAHVFVIEMVKDAKDSVCHNIPLLMIDLGRCSDITPEIIALLLFNAALVELENFYSHIIGENFYMSHLQSYAICATKTKRNRSFQGTHTKLVNTTNRTVALLQSVVTGLTTTVHCHSLSDIVHAVFRPVGQPNPNRQSVSKSMNQQQSFTSHGDSRDTVGSVSSTNEHEHTAGKQEDMLQSSAAMESNNQPLQITTEGYQMSRSNDDTDLQEDTVEKDGHSPLPNRNKNVNVGMLSASTSKQDVTKKDGKSSMTSGIGSRNQDLVESKYNDVMPVGKDHVGADSLASNQQLFTNSTSHDKLASQRNLRDVGDAANNHNEGKRLDIQQSNAATKERDRPLDIRPESYHIAASNANVYSSRKEKNVVDEKDGCSPLPIQKNQKVVSNLVENVVEKDGKLSMASGADQATLLSSDPTAHKLMIGNVTPQSLGSVGHSSLGAQLVKVSPRETEVLPKEVQSSREEVRHKGNARTTFYQHEVEQRAYNPTKIGEFNSTTTNPPVNNRPQVKPPEVKIEASKGANDFKPKPLPKRSCIVCGNKQYPLSNNLVSLPHMDHYFVKERKEIRPSHYLAKLVLRHQYQNRDDVNEETPAITAAQQSQAAVLAADSAVEKDGAVTERKHFPMNLNRPGFVVFSSDLTRFTGSTKYPLPSRKATAVKLGKGGNGFVFAIFHNGKEYAVKKTVYRPNEIRVHSQLAHSNLVNLDAVLVGEEHEKHKGKFYAFCFMTKCDMDFRSVISTKDHGCLKHLKLQLSDQRDVWQLVMVNVKYVLRSVLKALDYMHAQGLVHRDVKASNILLKMQCNCSKPLMCACPQKYLVKLGDFDSSTTVPGHGLRIEPHQMIRYASVLPLGTMGYRAPEVSMHLVIAGPYEVLYTTAVDIWSFGCLLLNMLIGKCGPLKQRGEASLLLSMQEQPYSESLYMQIIKIKELQKYYGNMPEMVDLVRKCLQVKVHCRPSAKQLLQLDILQCV